MAFIVRYRVTKNKMNEFVNKVKEVFMDLLLGYIPKCRILMQKWGTLKSKIFIPDFSPCLTCDFFINIQIFLHFLKMYYHFFVI